MIISYQGTEAFKISQGDLSIAVNPMSARGSADITLISSSVFALESKPASTRDSSSTRGGGFVISGPGEYEVKDVVIKGFLSESSYGAEKRVNTIYMISFEGMNLCFLGPLSNPALPSETLEHLEDIDILFMPLAEGTLDTAAAYKLAVSLEPSIIIPMHYTAESLKKFLKEAGEEASAPLDKLVIKKKDLEGKEGDIVVLKEE